MSLDAFTDSELRDELESREAQRSQVAWADLNERYGPCPECGAGLRAVESESVQQNWAAPKWQGWPVPPPDDWHGRELVAQEFRVTLTCVTGHSWDTMEFSTEAAAKQEP